MKTIKTDTFIGISFLFFALILYFVLIPVYIKPSPYGDVQERIVSSKFLPTVTAWAVGLLSLIMIFQTEFGKRGKTNTSPLRIKTDMHIVLGILLCLAYIILMHVFGFFIATLLVLAGLLTLFGERHPVKIILISLGSTTFFYIIFAKLLMVVFPSGILFY